MAKTIPLSAPTKTRPPATVGCERALATSPRAYAHFSLRRGTSRATIPGADWKRVLRTSAPHMVHDAPCDFCDAAWRGAVQSGDVAIVNASNTCSMTVGGEGDSRAGAAPS